MNIFRKNAITVIALIFILVVGSSIPIYASTDTGFKSIKRPISFSQVVSNSKPQIKSILSDDKTSLGFSAKYAVMDPNSTIIYFTDYADKRVYAYNYVTKMKNYIQFDIQPERLTYSNGILYVSLLKADHVYWGNYAPESGSIALIDVTTFFNGQPPVVKSRFDINMDPYDIAVDKQGYIYVSGGSNQWTHINSYSPQTYSLVSQASNYMQLLIDINPNYDRLYSIMSGSPGPIEAYNFSNGVFSNTNAIYYPYWGDYSTNPNFRLSPDGKYIFTATGNIFACSQDKNADMKYVNKLDSAFDDVAFDTTQNLIYSASKNIISVYDYSNFNRLRGYSTSANIINLFSKNNKVIALTDDGTTSYIEVLTVDNNTPYLHSVIKYPVDNSKEIPINFFSLIKFDAPLKAGANFNNISVKSTNGNSTVSLSGTIEKDSNGIANILSLDTNSDLLYNTSYVLTIPKDAVTDLAGNPLSSDITTAFSTGAEYTRLYGSDRYDTCSKISQDGWSKSNYAILATGDNFPDALSAAPLAVKYGAPILLTDSNTLNQKTASELTRLGVKNVFIVGGTGAVSASVESSVKNMGIQTTRISGSDRYATSAAIANLLGKSNTVVVATGDGFADALSIASYAAANQMPILLTTKDSLSSGAQSYIKANGVTKSIVVGGTGVVSDNVKNSLPNAVRYGGSNRYYTNKAILENLDFDFSYTYFATGENFPDALSGSALAGLDWAPIILVDKNMPSDYVSELNQSKSQMKMKYLLGGEAVVSTDIISRIFK